MKQSALYVYLTKFAAGVQKPCNTLARPRPGFMLQDNGPNGDFADIEEPYVMSEAYPWDNDSDYIKDATDLATVSSDEQRKQDIHELNLQHLQAKNELELEGLRLDLERSQAEFELKVQDMQQKQEDQRLKARAQSDTQEGVPQEPPPGIPDSQLKANLMQLYKGAYYYAQDQMPQEPPSAVKPMLVGGGLGALAANYIAPTDTARGLWEQARRLTKGDPNILKLRSRGLGANLKQIGKGSALGLLTGLIAHKIQD